LVIISRKKTEVEIKFPGKQVAGRQQHQAVHCAV